MSKRSQQRHRHEHREAEGEKRLAAMTPVMPVEEMRALDIVAETIERKVGVDESRQPRFSDERNLFTSVVRWASYCSLHEPSQRDSTQVWDKWYRDFVTQEPFLAGCLASAVQIDKNRGWTLTGGRNQVSQYTKYLHYGFIADATGIGWRPHIEWLANSFYTTMMGWIGEVGSQGKDGPLVKMWAVDPCCCTLTGNAKTPLHYQPRMGGAQDWIYGTQFLRGCSQKSTSEDKLGYGFPAVARCYTLAKIMAGVYRHYQMKTGITTPDGILAHNAMSDEQWQKALEVRKQELIADPDNYLNSVIAVGNPGGEVPQFVMTILSSLPEAFDIEAWTLILMRGYQLAFGYGSGEFYPEQYSVIGRGKEQEQQHRSSTGKGGKDFALTHQEQLQSRLPATLEFGYEERDVTGEIEDAQLAAAQAAVITEVNKWMIESGGMKQSVLTTDQIMKLAAEKGVVPEEWTPEEEDVTSTDEDTPDSERIARAMVTFPNEPIVRYNSRTGKTRVLFNRMRKVFAITKRQNAADPIIDDYDRQLEELVSQAQAGKISRDEMIREHTNLIINTADAAYLAGMQSGGDDNPQISDEDRLAIIAWMDEQLLHVGDFADSALAISGPEDRKKLDARILLWGGALAALATTAALTVSRDMLTFDGVDGLDSCRTCQSLKGKRHRSVWWLAHGLVPSPGNPNFECGSWPDHCHHYLRTDDGQRFSV